MPPPASRVIQDPHPLYPLHRTPSGGLGLPYALAAAIYTNFLAHHILPDIRLGLFAATLILYARTRVRFRISNQHH